TQRFPLLYSRACLCPSSRLTVFRIEVVRSDDPLKISVFGSIVLDTTRLMTLSISPDTQAALLLTASLITSSADADTDVLTWCEYLELGNMLAKANYTPSRLLESNNEDLPAEVTVLLDCGRLRRLLSRGFPLTQAIERWESRAIWVVGRTDDGYPTRFKDRLKDHSPPVIYGCGDRAILETGGLAVVGSRDVDPALIEFTENVGRLVAQADRTVVSGAALGVGDATMRGALEGGGRVAGVLADSLERAALNRAHRDLISDGRLVLISTYDPLAGFNICHAMQRK